MSELQHHNRSGLRIVDSSSPDSVIYTLDSSLFSSSASASVDRCSFASEEHSEISPNSAAHDESSDRDPDPNRHVRRSRKDENAKYNDAADSVVDSARSSFSLALKECLEPRSRRSEAVTNKPDRPRPASLDLNNATASSPRLGSLNKSSMAAAASRKSGTLLSPGTPTYRHNNGLAKGWSSERVPASANLVRKNNSNSNNIGAAVMLPFNNGRTLPSKWEDAERWIFSPVQAEGAIRQSNLQAQRRPKAKSGPLGPPGVAYYSLYSPAMPMFNGGGGGHNFMAGSPFSAGVMAADGMAFHSSGACNGNFPIRSEPCIARSVSVHGCSEGLDQLSSLPDSRDEKHDDVEDGATNVSRAVSRRDMATQMSPDDSTHSSPKEGHDYPASCSSFFPIEEMHNAASLTMDVRDVQVDERVTVTRWSKKHKALIHGKGSDIVDRGRKKDVDGRSCAWDPSNSAKNVSKVKREEAKIAAWENLQKAKAEAAIRKLEMKLEKKRSSSMDKIMNKLRSAQKKAQDMRSSVSDNRGHDGRSSRKTSLIRRTPHMGSLSGCFTCPAF